MRLYYAQNREDLLIKSFFPDVKKGFYIDVGANDPVIDSVTKIFYDEGWSGVNIDPIKYHFEALKSQRPRDININIGISNKEGTLTFTEYLDGHGLSTFDISMSEYYETSEHPFPTQKTSKYKVEVKSLNKLLSELNLEHAHFIKIDVEGYEYEVVSGYDWKDLRPELICIEASHILGTKDWSKILKDNDYELVYFDGVNNYHLAKEALHRKKYFKYENAVFAGDPVYYPAYKQIVEVEAEKNAPVFESYENKIRDQERDILFLHQQHRDIHFLAKRLNEEIQVRLNRRANGVKRAKGLTYKNDPKIAKELESSDLTSKKALLFIHAQDKENIVDSNELLKVHLKQYFWKIASKFYSFSIKIVKRVGRLV